MSFVRAWRLAPVTPELARQLTAWKYAPPYGFYNWDEEDDPAELLDGSYIACLDEKGELAGFFCFGKNAAIPTVEKEVYVPGCTGVGLGLAPALCGKGLGRDFVALGLSGAFPLTVACFNRRAQGAYAACGFSVEREVALAGKGTKFLVMTREGQPC